jgi:hypothetical protein
MDDEEEVLGECQPGGEPLLQGGMLHGPPHDYFLLGPMPCCAVPR